MKETNKKDEILKLLKKKGEMSTSKIAGWIRLNSPYTERYLDELKEEGKVVAREQGSYTYWDLKEKKK